MTVAALPEGPLPAGPWLEAPLFNDGTITGHNHPETSHYAARLVLPRTGTQRYDVLRCIVRAGAAGMTDEEIRSETGMRYSTQSPRRLELVQQGWVEDSGLRRATSTGSPAIVWRLSQRGHDKWYG